MSSEPVRLADLTTLRVGGPAREYVEVDHDDELVAVVAAADRAGTPVLVLGGGSNLLVADEGFPGTVVAVRTRGVEVSTADCSGAWLDVAAGESWDELVARAVAEGWVGLETLAGIPGLVGATPLQNVGAYGGQVADSLARVRAYDRLARRRVTLAAADCGFGYRTSRFKAEPGRFVVLGVSLQLGLGPLAAPVRYAELAGALGVEVGERVPAPAVRAAVLGLRRGKGMVLDPADHDTWSAGSFFTNPVLTPEQADRLPAAAPRFPAPDGQVKASAAWLIERAGFGRGHAGPGGAALSGKHALALTNR
ncbi:MAG TPA: UDP-N-acetylmuramate dehydrogenase, partial [Candidatus Nanopelagicales bacterium]|nr:UDP-N-acetylmuramate dehydrogenase [Candidatus Nanopelagicales bacterium]